MEANDQVRQCLVCSGFKLLSHLFFSLVAYIDQGTCSLWQLPGALWPVLKSFVRFLQQNYNVQSDLILDIQYMH